MFEVWVYMPLVIGITGGLATGKSAAAAIFEQLGALRISADELAREVVAAGTEGFIEIVERFGSEVVGEDGELNRPYLAQIIFSDEKARRDLEKITHPRIIAEMRRRIESFKSSVDSESSLMVCEIPLLYECGLEDMVDEVLVVTAEQETQVNRLTSRTGISRDEALRRIGSQMPVAEKARRAEWVIPNDGDMIRLKSAVEDIRRRLAV